MIPGDFFGIRTLLPNEEIMKRYVKDPEDKKKILIKRTVTKKISQGTHNGRDPIFH